ncbi:hypothetical protein [Streptococcus cuniculi]|uniref:Uncharacterized protein n=1 Tax=Streptococcus cuniculi TaxID=1432788 RepID=A0A4Y9J9L5_9STRE|nr:hypothetical protein [Streptococcus cuniculi]MBF0778839.1 hypothetical protein [Streptococcus cuniculi]TFU97221.1 hypothetical protein E4T82_08935 [Streptococcus cuniculi]
MKTKLQAFFSIAIGIALIFGSFYVYNDILLWEQEGGTRRLWIVLYVLYEIVGANAAFILFIPGGLLFFYNAYKLLSDKQEKHK